MFSSTDAKKAAKATAPRAAAVGPPPCRMTSGAQGGSGTVSRRPPRLNCGPLLELCAAAPRRVAWKDDDELRSLARTLRDEPMPS
jgi:hypothetical protein